MDELFDEMDKLLESFINTPPSSTDTPPYNTPSNNTTVEVSPDVQQDPSSLSSSCQATPSHTKTYCRKDVILLSSKKADVSKKGIRMPTESNANIQNLLSDVNDFESGQEMKLADFFKPGPFKRKRTQIQNTSSSKKCRLGIVYSKHRKTDDV
jgi:hypothetical protein